MILDRVIHQLSRWGPNRKVAFEGIEIYHETNTAILVELEDQSVWLPKAEIEIIRRNGSVSVHVPLRLIKRKFPAHKHQQFSKF